MEIQIAKRREELYTKLQLRTAEQMSEMLRENTTTTRNGMETDTGHSL